MPRRRAIGLVAFALIAFYPFFLKAAPSPERFFDFDKDGRLNWHELGRLNTYRIYRWELANTKKKRRFDLNGDRMLNPTELKLYQERKQNKKNKKAPLL